MANEDKQMCHLSEVLARFQSRNLKTASGNQSLRPEAGSACPLCNGIGFVVSDVPFGNELFGKAVICKCRVEEFKQARGQALMKFCRLPANSGHMTLENFTVLPWLEDAYQAALDFLDDKVRFLTYVSPVDRGKTHLAVGICHEYLKVNKPAKYAYTPMLLDELRNSYDKGAEYNFQAVFQRYCDVPLLIMDDLYREKVTEWGEEKLTSLINARYMNAASTIFTTNKSLAIMADAIQSRLQREDWCRVVVIEGQEYRLRERAAL